MHVCAVCVQCGSLRRGGMHAACSAHALHVQCTCSAHAHAHAVHTCTCHMCMHMCMHMHMLHMSMHMHMWCTCNDLAAVREEWRRGGVPVVAQNLGRRPGK